MMFLMSYNRLRKLLLLVTTSYAPQICIKKMYSHIYQKRHPPYMAKPFSEKKNNKKHENSGKPKHNNLENVRSSLHSGHTFLMGDIQEKQL